MTGAVTALGDTLFPKTDIGFELGAGAHFLERLRIVHPVIAIVGGLFVVAASRRLARGRPGAARWAGYVHLLFWIQVAAGALNVALLAPVWLQLVHLLLADAFWLAVVLVAAAAFGEEPVAAPRRAASAVPAAAGA
jgi:heme a synthase